MSKTGVIWALILVASVSYVTSVVSLVDCTIPINAMNISTETIFCNGTYYVPDGIRLIENHIGVTCDHTILVGSFLPESIGVTTYAHNNTIDGCTVMNFEKGISTSMTSHLMIRNNLLENNHVGIGFWKTEHSIIQNNTITNFQDGIQLFDTSDFNIIIDNIIFNEQQRGNGIHFFISTSHNVIDSNNISGCSNGILAESMSIFNSIMNNRISDNTVSGINIRGNARYTDIEHNVIINNGRKTSAGLTGGIIIYNGRNHTISYNNISNNAHGLVIRGANTHSNQIHHNNFVGNHRYDLMNIQEQNINAVQNYWGTNNTQLIPKRIYDHNDNAAMGIVYYLPALITPVST